MLKLYLLFFVCILQGNFGSKSYRGYHMIKGKNNDRLLDKIGLKEDYDKIRSFGDDQSLIIVHPSEVLSVVNLLKNSGIDFNIVTKDLQKNIDEERKVPKNWFKNYHNFEDILQWLKAKQAKHPQYSSLHNIGRSYYNRSLQVIKIIGKKNNCTQKPSIWIDSGIHAREWISHSTGMYLIERLLEDFEYDPFVKYMRNTYDWYFLVVTNPDGYDYSWTNDRMWRKSRSPNNGSPCVGTDINRNFDFQWMTVGAINHPCIPTYAGEKAFSEPEAKAVADFILSKNGTWDLFITLHSFGHFWLSPWGYTKDLPDNYKQLEKVGMEAVKAIYNFSKINYRFGSSANILYPSSGTSRDWAKAVPNIPLVYTVELRDAHDFIVPESEIIPTGIEIWRAVKASVKAMMTELPPSCKP